MPPEIKTGIWVSVLRNKIKVKVLDVAKFVQRAPCGST